MIELLVVLTIILILAALILNIAGSVNYKASFSRAQSEIQAMSTACESYKSDFGAYPRAAATDTLLASGPSANIDPAAPAPSPNYYQAAGVILYQALSGTTYATASGPPTFSKPYMTFNPSQFYPTNSSGSPISTTYIIDPFGYCYGYSTANQANSSNGFNPNFDMWSTGGYSPTGGKPYPSASPVPSPYTFWARNW